MEFGWNWGGKGIGVLDGGEQRGGDVPRKGLGPRRCAGLSNKSARALVHFVEVAAHSFQDVVPFCVLLGKHGQDKRQGFV